MCWNITFLSSEIKIPHFAELVGFPIVKKEEIKGALVSKNKTDLFLFVIEAVKKQQLITSDEFKHFKGLFTVKVRLISKMTDENLGKKISLPQQAKADTG